MTPVPQPERRLAYETNPRPPKALTRSRVMAAAAIAAGFALESVFIDHGSPVFRFPAAASEFFERVHEFLRD